MVARKSQLRLRFLFIKMFRMTPKLERYLFYSFWVIITFFVFDITFGPLFIKWVKLFDVHNGGNYLILNFFYKAVPTFIGIVVGFWFDKWRTYVSFMDDVDKIAPLIEIELWENYQLVSKKPPINIQREDFHTDYWEIYKNELSKWAYINIITLTEIYGLIKQYKKGDLNCIHRIKNNLEFILDRYHNWYSKEENKSARKEKENAIDKYEKLELSTEQIEILIHMKKEMKALKTQLKHKY